MIIRDPRYSSIVSGSLRTAFGFRPACARWVMGSQPSCSLVVPNRWKCRCAIIASQLAVE